MFLAVWRYRVLIWRSSPVPSPVFGRQVESIHSGACNQRQKQKDMDAFSNIRLLLTYHPKNGKVQILSTVTNNLRLGRKCLLTLPSRRRYNSRNYGEYHEPAPVSKSALHCTAQKNCTEWQHSRILESVENESQCERKDHDLAEVLSKRSFVVFFLITQAGFLSLNDECAYSEEGRLVKQPSTRQQVTDGRWPQFQKLSDGLQVLDIREGTGENPAVGEKVVVHYYARLAAKQGWRFDSTYEHKDETGDVIPFEFVVGTSTVIAGLSLAVASMKVGGTRRAIIPPNLGYQTMQDQPLPPNFSDRQRLFTTIFNPTRLSNGEGSTLGTLVFDIQLLAVRK